MENKKRCGNCGRYPFCKTTKGASDYCDEWIKRICEFETMETEKNDNNTKM